MSKSKETALRCGPETPVLTAAALQDAVKTRLPDWQISDDGLSIARRLTFKGFAKPVYHCNLASFLADKSGHHPDLNLGWGYFEIRYTTHDAGGVTELDLRCAEAFETTLA